jgi:hypothetical protein
MMGRWRVRRATYHAQRRTSTGRQTRTAPPGGRPRVRACAAHINMHMRIRTHTRARAHTRTQHTHTHTHNTRARTLTHAHRTGRPHLTPARPPHVYARMSHIAAGADALSRGGRLLESDPLASAHLYARACDIWEAEEKEALGMDAFRACASAYVRGAWGRARVICVRVRVCLFAGAWAHFRWSDA